MQKTVLICLLILTPFSLVAYERAGPFPHVIQNPAYLWHISSTPKKAHVLDKNQMNFEIISDYSNAFEMGMDGNSTFDFDMEIWRVNFTASRGMGNGFELFFEWPFLHMSGGFLDSTIQEFHKAFRFPNGGRDQVKNGLFRYKITKAGVNIIDYPPVSFLPGDLKLGFRNEVFKETKNNPGLTFGFAFDLPTAPANRGVGSDDLDFVFSLDLEKGFKRWAVYFNTAYALFSTSGFQEEYVREAAWQYALAGEFMIARWISLIAEFVGGSPQLKGIEDDSWNGWPLDFIIGFSGNINSTVGTWQWRVAFAEDIMSSGTSIDFTGFATIGWSPNFDTK